LLKLLFIFYIILANTKASTQPELNDGNTPHLDIKSKIKSCINVNLSTNDNLLNEIDQERALQNKDNTSRLSNTNIPIENISDILNDNDTLKEKLLKQIVDIYKNNPDKLLNDLGPSDFAKVNIKYILIQILD